MSPPHSFRVLVVEDDPDIRFVLESAVRGLTDDVEVAADGLEALGYLAERSFSVVVCDLQLPGVDGFEICERVHNVAPETTLLATSGFLEPEAAAALRSLGADFLAKPFRLHQLREKISAAIERHHKTNSKRIP